MNLLFILIPTVIYIVNEYHQNKIFNATSTVYKHRKFIMLITPFVLLYIRPDILKKIKVYFHQNDSPLFYQDGYTYEFLCNIKKSEKIYNNRSLNLPNKESSPDE